MKLIRNLELQSCTFTFYDVKEHLFQLQQHNYANILGTEMDQEVFSTPLPLYMFLVGWPVYLWTNKHNFYPHFKTYSWFDQSHVCWWPCMQISMAVQRKRTWEEWPTGTDTCIWANFHFANYQMSISYEGLVLIALCQLVENVPISFFEWQFAIDGVTD